MEDQLQQAAARALDALSSRPRRQRDAVFDCYDDAGDDAWAAAVQRHAVSIVLTTAVERVVARATTRSLFERHQQQLALACPPPTTVFGAHDAGVQAGAGDAGHVMATVALDFSQCLDRIAKAAVLPLPPNTRLSYRQVACGVDDAGVIACLNTREQVGFVVGPEGSFADTNVPPPPPEPPAPAPAPPPSDPIAPPA